MTALNGKNLQLSLGNAATPTEAFSAIGSFRATQFQLTQEIVDASNCATAAWRELTTATGRRAVSVSVEGVVQDSAIEDSLRQIAMSGSIRNYRIAFGNGDYLQGAFMMRDYQQTGELGEAQLLSLALESAGNINYVAG